MFVLILIGLILSSVDATASMWGSYWFCWGWWVFCKGLELVMAIAKVCD